MLQATLRYLPTASFDWPDLRLESAITVAEGQLDNS
jgi:hypothetical protein